MEKKTLIVLSLILLSAALALPASAAASQDMEAGDHK